MKKRKIELYAERFIYVLNSVIEGLGVCMNELEVKEAAVSKKPIWKNRTVWIIGLLAVLFVAYKAGSSQSVPEGIEENHYEQALWVFHELNVAFEEGKYPSNDVTSWVSDHARIIERDASDYTEKEIYINGS